MFIGSGKMLQLGNHMAVKQQVKSAVYMSGTNILFPISFNEIWNEINYIRLILSVFYDQSFSRTSTRDQPAHVDVWYKNNCWCVLTWELISVFSHLDGEENYHLEDKFPVPGPQAAPVLWYWERTLNTRIISTTTSQQEEDEMHHIDFYPTAIIVYQNWLFYF